MSNTKTYLIPNFEPGMYMLYFITSQTAADVYVTIEDESGKQYAQFHSDGNTDPTNYPSQGFVKLAGGKISVSITDSSGTDKAAIKSYTLENPDNDVAVGYGWACATEDSTDNDFNDVWISLTAWNSKG